ncbi:MAG: LysM peptidoglycan-binding domain-containing protein, partial [Verrucomicrobiales bacterium]|nr:LysM peptidoglycan-binding domain-containing protein [Verrucomicrobiales bacterium]
PAAESSEIVHQLELIRLEIAQQGRRIATLEHASAVAGQTPNYHVVAPTQPAGHTPNPILQPSSPQAKTYTVRLGDSLSIIAKRHGVSIASIVEANQLASADKIKIGQRLTIPTKPAPQPTPPERPTPTTSYPPPTSAQTHELQTGETLFSVARRYGVKVEDIQSHNGIADPTTVWAGQVLRIPGTRSSQETVVSTSRSKQPTTAPAARGAKDGKHTIVRGESLTRIAAAHGVSISDLQSINGINDPDQIFIGQTLILPGSGVVAKKITTKTTATKVATHTPNTRSATTPTPQPTAPRTEDLGVDDFMGYFVVSGDTVESIASIFNTSASRLRRINDIPSGGQFRAGDQILVPADAVFSS